MRLTTFTAALTLVAGSGLFAAAAAADCPTPPALSACKACHALEPGKPSRVTGPNLTGVPGQPAMHSADFKGYSPAMKAAQAKGLIWTDDNLMAYIADPKGFLTQFNGEALKNAMAFQLKDEAKRKAAVEGLKTISACQ
jgi:cytochrome c